MKAFFRLLTLFTAILLLVGCAENNIGISNSPFGEDTVSQMGILNYRKDSYYLHLAKTQNTFCASFSGEGSLGGYSFLRENGVWYISYLDKNMPFDAPFEDSLINCLYLYTLLDRNDFVKSEDENTALYRKENTDFKLKFDNEGNIARMECRDIKFTPEVNG